MSNVQQTLLQRRAALANEGAAIFASAAASNRDLTDAERTRDDEIDAAVAVLDKDIARHEANRARQLSEPSAITDVVDLGAAARWGAKWGADKVLADKNADPIARERARNLALGDQGMAIYKAQTRQGVDPRLLAAVPGQGMNETIGPDGGYLVATDIQNELAVSLQSGAILGRVKRLSLSSNANSLRVNYVVNSSEVDGSQFGGVQAYWLEEGGQKLPSKPAFDFLQLTLHKLAVLAIATDEVLQDVSILGSMIFQMMSEGLRWKVESAIFGGNGAGKPLGFASPGNTSLITVTAKAGAPAARVQFEDIAEMWMRLNPASQANAVWFVNPDTQFALSTMSMTLGAIAYPVLIPQGGISGAPYSTIYNRPVLPIAYASTLGTLYDIVLADLSQYDYLEKGGIQTATSIHLYFDTDETAFRAVLRCDGAPAWKLPKTPAVGSSTTSPFVALSTRA